MNSALPPKMDSERRWGTRVTILVCIALVAAPLVVRQGPREVSQWYLAAAVQQRAAGELERAQANIDAARRWSPTNANVLLADALWLRKHGDAEQALTRCEELIAAWPDDPRGYLERSHVLQQLGRASEAIADWKTLASLNERQPFMSEEQIWNGMAYARAIANEELVEGLADANRAARGPAPAPELLDTRGYLYYRLGRHEEARRDLDEAIARYQPMFNDRKRRFEIQGPAAGLGKLDENRRAELMRESALGLAVMRYHRALVLDALGETVAADDERKQVQELGFQPNESLF
ncbi:MAG: tetratricopeptide repeat protein [Planctomycetota bacterium]